MGDCFKLMYGKLHHVCMDVEYILHELPGINHSGFGQMFLALSHCNPGMLDGKLGYFHSCADMSVV